FSIANDVAKYFAIIPALFAAVYPGLDKLNIMGLSSPDSAILSAVIFNALIIIALVPLSLRGVQYRPVSADKMLRRNLTIYGIGGLVAPRAERHEHLRFERRPVAAAVPQPLWTPPQPSDGAPAPSGASTPPSGVTASS
ncbi:hypothetical protein AB0D34_07315, partial [Streptomyces sp. NPDC048420]